MRSTPRPVSALSAATLRAARKAASTPEGIVDPFVFALQIAQPIGLEKELARQAAESLASMQVRPAAPHVGSSRVSVRRTTGTQQK